MVICLPLLRLTLETSLRADAWALKHIAEFQSGKLVLHAWLSRGLVSQEELLSAVYIYTHTYTHVYNERLVCAGHSAMEI